MELLITREQKEGMMGGITFQLAARVDLTEEEAEAVAKYKLLNLVVYEKPRDSPDKDSFWSVMWYRLRVERIHVGDLVHGSMVESDNVLEIVQIEEQLKAAAKTLHDVLKASVGYVGETALTFDTA